MYTSVCPCFSLIHSKRNQTVYFFSKLAASRSSHSQCSVDFFFFFSISQNLQDGICVRVSVITFQAYSLKREKKKLRYRYFHLNFASFLELHNNSMQQFLNRYATATSITSFWWVNFKFSQSLIHHFMIINVGKQYVWPSKESIFCSVLKISYLAVNFIIFFRLCQFYI